MKLSHITTMSVNKLKLNELNRQYFTQDNAEEITALEKDIEARGILVPLIAKGDGTLLAGHRRLLIARKLKIKRVPVQIAKENMTREQEIEFLVKDNLLRRQLSHAERDALYRSLYKDLEERILLPKSSLSIKAKDVAKATGLNEKTVNWDLNMLRAKRKKELRAAAMVDVLNEKAVESYKKAVARMLNAAEVESDATLDEFRKIAAMTVERLESKKQMRAMAPKRLT